MSKNYFDCEAREQELLDTDTKVRVFLMEATRTMWALSKCDALSKRERHTMAMNWLYFTIRCNWTANLNRVLARKIYARFAGGYCEALNDRTELGIGLLFDQLAASIANGESKQEQKGILIMGVNYLYKL